VLSDFGGGDVLVGRDALDAGMCDGLGTLEAALAELQQQTRPAAAAARVTFGAPARARADGSGASRATFGAR
jgi:ClpP class serine protease